MKELGDGSIINFSSIAWSGGAGMPVYAAAKSGVIGLTRALSPRLRAGQYPRQRDRAGRRDHRPPAEALVRPQQDIDNVVVAAGDPALLLGQDIARVVLFLAADDSRDDRPSQSIIVDGGLT